MIDRLVEGIRKKQAPIVVGLDPQMGFIPGHIREKAFADYGETLEGAAAALLEFNRGIVDAVADLVPAVKPQSAMYEMYGAPGVKAYKDTIDYCHEKGLVVIGDVKRGDIGSTSAAYAQGHLGTVKVGSRTYAPFDEDFCTVNPYLGSDGIKPFLDVCADCGRGIFVLVKTSNPSSGELQNRKVDERTIYEIVGQMVASWGSGLSGAGGWSQVGAVVGATYPETGKVLRKLMPKNYILVPGYGAQGGRGKDLVHFFDQDGLGAIVNSSRGIIAAWQKDNYAEFGPSAYAEAARAAVLDMKEDIAEALNA